MDELVELVDGVAPFIQDLAYMRIMQELQKIHNLLHSRPVPAGNCGCDAEARLEHVQAVHSRLKRTQRNRRREWALVKSNMEQQISELMQEIEYYEQFLQSRQSYSVWLWLQRENAGQQEEEGGDDVEGSTGA